MIQATATTAPVDLKMEKYLTFGLGNEVYGMDILKVMEIIGRMDTTTVPNVPAYILGVINLRGRIVPVTDLRTRFGMPPLQSAKENCIIVVSVNGVEMGLLVDRVKEVVELSGEDVEETPSFGAGVDTKYISGIGKVQGQITILLDIDKVFSAEEIAALPE